MYYSAVLIGTRQLVEHSGCCMYSIQYSAGLLNTNFTFPALSVLPAPSQPLRVHFRFPLWSATAYVLLRGRICYPCVQRRPWLD